MIRNLRNSGIGQIFLGAIVVAIILAFVLTGTSSGVGLSDGECAVEVGDDCVSPKEFFAAYGLLSAIGPGGISEAAASKFRLREQVARGLAEREVLLDEARRLGIGTSEEDLDEELIKGRTRVSLPADDQLRLAASLGMCVPGPGGCEPGTIGLRNIQVTRDGQFDFEVYKRSVRIWTKRSLAHFKKMQANEYTAERVRQLIRSQVRVSEEEAFLAFSRLRSEATARTVQLDAKWFGRYLGGPDSEAIDTYKKANAETLKAAAETLAKSWTTDCAVVSEILVESLEPGSDKAKEAEKEANKLRLAAMSGKNFAELAARHSAAPSATLGGRVGCLNDGYGAGAAVLKEAAAELKRPGQISPVVETIRGFVILKLEDRVSEENRAQLVEDFAAFRAASQTHAKNQAKTFGEELIKLAKDKPLDEALSTLLKEKLGDEEHPALAAEGHPQVEISRAVTIDQNPFEGATGDVAPGVLLFDLEKENALVEEPIETLSGFAVMQLKSKDMLTHEKFEEDRTQVMATLRARKAEQALSDHVSRLIKKAGGVVLNQKYIPPADEDGQDDEEKDS